MECSNPPTRLTHKTRDHPGAGLCCSRCSLRWRLAASSTSTTCCKDDEKTLRGIDSMEKVEILDTRAATLTIRQIESFVLLAAMLLAITLEGGCVYWLWAPGALAPHSVTQVSLVGQWTAATLPQCWLLGAVVVLVYRIALMLVPPRSWGLVDLLHNRRAFVRLWRWMVAVAAVQMCALYFDHLTSGVQ